MFYTIEETVKALKSGETTSAALVKASVGTFENDKKSEKPLNAFLEIYDDVVEKANAADAEIAEARKSVPVQRSYRQTCT